MDLRQFYQSLSISTKLLALIVSLVLICVVMLSFFSSSSLSKISQQQLDATEAQLKQSVLDSMKLTGQNAAAKVEGLLNQSFTVPYSLASVLGNTAHPQQPLSREHVRLIDRSFLEANQQISAIYSQFEEQAYDKLDKQNVGNLKHSSNSGTLEIYWVRENGELVYYPVDDPEEKHDTELNEYGIRAAEWYLCGKDTLKPCALDPYLYEIEPGKEVLMTTLTAPVVVKGQFRGTVGIDINLPVIQQWLEEQSKEFYSGQSRLTLVSQNGLLVASSEYPDKLGHLAQEASSGLNKLIEQQKSAFLEKDFWHIKVPVHIALSGTDWQLLVSVPTNIALKPLLDMQEVASDTLASERTSFIIVAVVLLVIATILGVWLSRSVSRPIEVISGSVAKLASNEGDLTQAINVHDHKELNQVSEGLNRFMEKLRDMIISLKSDADELNRQVDVLDTRAHSMQHETDEQESNLDNVVTAINEMAATATEVASLASGTADNASNSAELLNKTRSNFQHNVEEVNQLASQIQASSARVTEVSNRTESITSIIATIQSIAEQTNLLALNAAIEAARAGDQGRGFAVVADEVRGLAARTQTSTKEISDLIQNLQKKR
ncbi:methyl-accepting chemotaxis protein [Neptunicella marina]|uniref:HAMP domain-containing protein n=1 Tax=Neptunicella marina TaxID=2125989 RepID=A0A8J6M265_9ALTE|nr:methyl-accepting chemotaxis protein [Neptunicella marina]MBC3765967.1 HAMP domain-containing protein [Neptunicella marina]